MQVHTHNEQDCALKKNDHTTVVKFAQTVYDAHHHEKLYEKRGSQKLTVHKSFEGLQGLQGKKASVKTFDC
eukprot:987501-Pelagomonas_calceolata.AAC.1